MNMNIQITNPDMPLVERATGPLRRATCPPLFALPLTLLLLLTSSAAHAATQVGSAPYRASATGAGNSHAPVFSADGKHIAFVSHANNLVTNDDLAPHLDLFVRDLVTSNTVLVSVSTNGFGGGNDNVGLYSMSSNAQVIAFDTVASNFLPWDDNRVSDIYVRDLQFGGMTRVSWGLDGEANGPSYNPLLSEDGQRVIFESLASNLVTNDFNGTNDLFIHDLTTGVTELVSVNADGTASPDGPSHSPSISADGLTVAFVSHATNLVEGVTNMLGEVYARNISAGTTRWAVASHIPWATRESYAYQWRIPIGGTGISTSLFPYVASSPVLSANGRFVAFKTLGSMVRFDFDNPTNSIFLSYTNDAYPLGKRVNYLQFDDNPRLGGISSEAPLRLTANGRYAAFETATNAWPHPGIKVLDFESLATNVISTYSGGGCQGCPYNFYVTNIGATVSSYLTNFNSVTGRESWTAVPWLHLTPDASRLFFLADATNFFPTGARRTSQLYSLSMASGLVSLISSNITGNSPDLSGVIPSVSPDGSLIAWDSPDDTLVPDDLNRALDVFVRNVDTGETQLISARRSGLPAASGLAMSRLDQNPGAISGNGNRVAVLSLDSTLAPGDANNRRDLFIRDFIMGTNIPVSLSSGEARPTLPVVQDTNAAFPSLSVDGRFLAFAGESVLFLGNTNRTIFWRDLQLPTNQIVVGGTQNNPQGVFYPVLSPNGCIVAFHSAGFHDANIQDGNGQTDVFVQSLRRDDQDTNDLSFAQYSNLSLISRAWQGNTAANAASLNPAFSPDSRWLIFQSLASDLIDDSAQIATHQLYARNLTSSNFIKRISYSNSEGTNAPPLTGGATHPSFSADARFVFFEGNTSNLIYRHDLLNDMDDSGTARRPNLVVCSGCANPSASSDGRYVAYESRPTTGGVTNVFLKDIESGQVELISVSLAGTNGNGSSFTPLLSHDARFVVFASKASDLVPGDSNRATDIFVRDRWAGATHALSRNLAGTGTGNRVSSNPILSADGRTVAFQSFASDLVAGDYNDTRDVFVVTLGGPDNDGDTMEDDWEMAYFNTLDRDGSGDFDQDGASDLAEFRAGTNPANDASILRVLRLTTGVAAGLEASRTTVILWSAVPGRTYRVESKASLSVSWESVGADVVASTVSASATHTLGGAAVQMDRFYRVLLVQ